MRRLSSLLPIAGWLGGYGRADLQGDLAAGLTVGVMLVPQAMAYAVLAGVPPIYGLYASLVPLLAYPLFGTSRHLAVGVIAIDMLIVAAGLAPLAEAGTTRYVELAVLLAFLVGALQVAMGLARMGFLVNLLSRPVIIGFTSAAALVIVIGQLGNLLGVALPQTQQVHVILWSLFEHAGEVRPASLLVGLGGLAVLVPLRRWKPLFPAALAVVVAGTAAAWQWGWPEAGVAAVGAVPTGLPMPTAPAVDGAAVRALLPTAATLALMQFMSVISLGKVYGARHRYGVDANRELLGVGAANLAGSLFRAIPVSGSFSRTAVNAQAGARTPLANVFAAALIIVTLLFLTPLLAFLPIAILAAIIIVAAAGLFDARGVRELWRIRRLDGAVALLTFVTTLLAGIQEGVLTGIAASVVVLLYRISRPNVAVLGLLPGTRSYRDVQRHDAARPHEGILVLRVDASFCFANAELLKDLLLSRTATRSDVEAVVIDASSINDLDATAAHVLEEVAETLSERGVALYFGGTKSPVMDVMERSGLVALLGQERFFLSPRRAVEAIEAGRIVGSER